MKMKNNEPEVLSIKDIVLLKQYPEEYYRKYLDYEYERLSSQRIRRGGTRRKSYSHKPYLANMPYDRNTRDPYKMCARYMALSEYEKTLKQDIENFDGEFDIAVKTFKDARDEMKELESEASYLDGEIDKAVISEDRFEKDQIDWDADLKTEKQHMMNSTYEYALGLDYAVMLNDPAFNDFDMGEYGENLTDDYGEWVMDEPAGRYGYEVWDKPLRDIEDSIKDLDGICSPQTSQAIDKYISQLEALPIKENTWAYDSRERAIWELRQLQANTSEEWESSKRELMPNSTVNELIDKKDEVWEKWDVARGVQHEAKKDMIEAKKKSHERNVALYETVNEKQNCADVFEETKGNAFANPNENIDSYIDRTNFKQYLNKDGTVNEKAIRAMEDEIYADVVGWERVEMQDWI